MNGGPVWDGNTLNTIDMIGGLNYNYNGNMSSRPNYYLKQSQSNYNSSFRSNYYPGQMDVRQNINMLQSVQAVATNKHLVTQESNYPYNVTEGDE